MTTSLPTYTGDTTALVPLTGNSLTDALLVGSKWGTSPAGTGATLTFSFPETLAAFDARENIAGNYNPTEVTSSGFASYLQGFSAFSNTAKDAARAVLGTWANVATLGFIEVAGTSADAGVLRFANTAPPGIGGTTYGVSSFPQDFAGAGDTWINSAFVFPEGWSAGTQNFLTLLHEVGHALGLKHPHDAGMGGEPGWPQSPSILQFTGTDTLATQSTQTMVMAYNDIPGVSQLGGESLQSDFAPTTPMRYDIAAIQYLYGPNTTYNAGDTEYIFVGDANYNETIWDAGGIDTIVATGTRNVEIDLNAGQWSKLGKPVTFSTRNADLSVATAQPALDDPYTVFLYDTVTIENAIGGLGDDILIGNAVNNILRGNGGNDTIGGGAGTDTAMFTGTRADHTIAKSSTGWTVSSVADGSDTLIDIERLKFSDSGLALDLTAANSAGGIYRLYGATFNRTPDLAGLGYWIDQADKGKSAVTMAIDFTYSAEFQTLFATKITDNYATGANITALVTGFYTNVLHRTPDAAGRDWYADQITTRQKTVGQVLAEISDSPENIAQLAGVIANGIVYTPWGG
jgi:serralysin